MKFALILLLSLCSVQSMLPISAKNDCIWGVSYWCQSRDTAMRCGKLDYCRSIWKGNFKKQSIQHSVECTACDVVVKLLKVWIDKNSTEVEVKKAVLSQCDVATPIKFECHTIITEYFNILWSGLQKEMDPKELCGVTLSCLSSISNIQDDSSQHVGNVIKDLECKICKAVVGKFDDPDTFEQKLEAKLDALCSLMPESNEKKECTGSIKIILDTLKNGAEKFFNSDAICTEVGYCDKVAVKISEVQRVQQNLCDLCKLAVELLKPYVDSNSTENDAKEVLERVCNLLPSSYKSECTKLVNGSFLAIWDMLKKDVDNGSICKMLGLCNSTEVMISRPVKGFLLCAVCEVMMTKLDELLEKNRTESHVMNAIEKVCEFLPSGYSKDCSDVIDKYGSTIYKLIVEGIDSKLICKMIGICTGESTPIETISGASCNDCQEGLKVVKLILPLESKSIIEGMKSICELMAGAISGECDALVNEYGSEFVNDLANDIDPLQICKDLDFCNSSTKHVQVTNGMTCRSCNYKVKKFESIFSKNSHYFIQMIGSLCKSVPAEKTCTTIIMTHWHAVYQQLHSTLLNHREVCQHICGGKKLHPHLDFID